MIGSNRMTRFGEPIDSCTDQEFNKLTEVRLNAERLVSTDHTTELKTALTSLLNANERLVDKYRENKDDLQRANHDKYDLNREIEKLTEDRDGSEEALEKGLEKGRLLRARADDQEIEIKKLKTKVRQLNNQLKGK